MSLAAEANIDTDRQPVSSGRSWRLFCLPLAILIYALWGTPTPDGAGWAEFTVGLLLVLSIGLPRAAQALKLRGGLQWERAATLLLLYGLSVPIIAGLLYGNAPAAIMRDVIPFLFLLLPLFAAPLWQGREKGLLLLTAMVAALGIVFSLRVLLPSYLALLGATPGSVPDPFLLANAPTVLFAALLLAGLGGFRLYKGLVFSGLALLLLAVIPLLTMGLIGQRASVGVFCLAGLLLGALGLWRRPLRMALPLALAAIVIMIGWPFVREIGTALAQKNAAVGFNMRWQEAAAVMQALGGSVFTVIFGKGWGASVASPAVGGAVVNFTHSLLTTYWLKAGLAGLVLVMIYLYRIGELLLPILCRWPVMAVALAGPFAIDILLYASFKSFDFGLVLLLIPLWAYQSRLAATLPQP